MIVIFGLHVVNCHNNNRSENDSDNRVTDSRELFPFIWIYYLFQTINVQKYETSPNLYEACLRRNSTHFKYVTYKNKKQYYLFW